MTAFIFISVVVGGIFAGDGVRRWRRKAEWQRRHKRRLRASRLRIVSSRS